MKIYIKKHVRYIFYEESVKYTFQFIFYVRSSGNAICCTYVKGKLLREHMHTAGGQNNRNNQSNAA